MKAPVCLDAEVRPVPGFPGLSVSASGQVYGPKGLRRQDVSAYGHLSVALRHGRGWRRLQVHRAVLLAWVGPCPPGRECRHLDGDPSNNHVSNLVWGTSSENKVDTLRHGNSPFAKLTEEEVRAMRAMRPTLSISALARHFGVGPTTVKDVMARRTWKHVS